MPPCLICTLKPGSTHEDSPAIWVSDWIRDNHSAPTPGFRKSKDGGELGPLEDRFNVKVPCCKDCNGWMNVNIEQPAMDTLKQLIIAASSLDELTVGDQTHVAAWILKVVICANPDSFSLAEKGRFRSTAVASDTDSIWIGQMTPPAERHEHNASHLLPKDFGKLLVNRRGAWPMGLYRLFSLLISKLDPAQPDIALPMALTQSRYLVRIWPPHDSSIPWPPRVMDGATVAAVQSMLQPGPAPINPFNGQPQWETF
jgi:hypothetical protein